MKAETEEQCRKMLEEAKAEANRIRADMLQQEAQSAAADSQKGIGTLLEEAKQLIGLQG